MMPASLFARLALSLSVLLVACSTDVSVGKRTTDADSDGYNSDVDCDDAHATVNPDAPEACDGVDNNCDGEVDEGADDAPTWFADADGDGHGDPDAPTVACDGPDGTVATQDDCDDAAASIFPGATEVCNDLDDDCNGEVDDNVSDAAPWYTDADDDGYGDAATEVVTCTPGPDEVADGTDCDDGDALVNPGAAEPDCADPRDYNCDGSTGYADADADGVAACEDCNDTDARVSPLPAEVCDGVGVDEDCDGLVNDDDASLTGTTSWGRDADADGYAGSGPTTDACDAPALASATFGDCDDADLAVNPAAAEVCDAADTDEDCNGAADDGDFGADPATWSDWYADNDSDTYGDASRSARQCDAPAGYVADTTDCDDASAAIHPGAAEVCDASNVDEDCDGLADDLDSAASGTSTWYRDADSDTYGGTTTRAACDLPSGYVADTTDCDDASAAIHPGAAEVCDDGLDQDCDGADEACPATVLSGTYDVDDGYSARIYGVAAADEFGLTLTAGDFDGDGYGDLLVASMENTYATQQGTVYGFLGPLVTSGVADVVADFGYYNNVSTYSGSFGGWMANVGDRDRDGVDDFAITDSGGNASVYHGADSGFSVYSSTDDQTVSCTSADDARNFTPSSDADEWVCGDWVYASSSGVAKIHSGSSTSTAVWLVGEDSTDYAGKSVAGAGDVNGDGNPDVWVGAFGDDTGGSNAGAVYLWYGPETGTKDLSAADAKVTGEASGSSLGWSLHMPGDLDGDGKDDVLASTYFADANGTDSGATYVIGDTRGGSVEAVAISRILGEAAYDYLGYGGATSGDFDGDGQMDFAVGATHNDCDYANSGAVWMFYGPATSGMETTSADATWCSAETGHLGAGLAGVPDTDGDGDDELAIGSYYTGTSGMARRGAVWIWEGQR